MKKTAFIYGTILALLLLLFKVIEYSFFSYKIELEMYIGIISTLFLIIGISTGIIYGRKKVKNPYNYQSLLSERENNVFELLLHGHSNKEMAEKLFISVNTIKTHISNIYAKLDVKNRAEAVRKYTQSN